MPSAKTKCKRPVSADHLAAQDNCTPASKQAAPATRPRTTRDIPRDRLLNELATTNHYGRFGARPSGIFTKFCCSMFSF